MVFHSERERWMLLTGLKRRNVGQKSNGGCQIMIRPGASRRICEFVFANPSLPDRTIVAQVSKTGTLQSDTEQKNPAANSMQSPPASHSLEVTDYNLSPRGGTLRADQFPVAANQAPPGLPTKMIGAMQGVGRTI